MLRSLAVLLLIAAILIIAFVGYGVWQMRPREALNSRVERPPPVPPNCDQASEIAAITRSDGSIANVRIVKVRDTKLFVPAEWLQSYFVDAYAARRAARFDRLEQFNPDIHETECPGVVHELNLAGPTPRRGTNRGSVTGFVLFGNFAPVELRGTAGRTAGFNVGVQPTVIPDGRETSVPRLSSVGDYWIQPNRDFFLTKAGPTKDEDRQKDAIELSRLAAWLREFPATREPDPLFFPPPQFP